MLPLVVDFYPTQQATIDALLNRLRPSLAILGDVRRPTGAAALVDSQQGLYLAHSDAIQGDTIQGKVGDWRVSMTVLAQDARTGLVLLRLRSGTPPEAPAIPVAETDPAPGTRIVVLLADGGFQGTFVGGQQFSIVGNQKFAVPVSELRFENPPRLVSGALVLSFDGKLVGTMGATVAREGNASSVNLRSLEAVRKALTRDHDLVPLFAQKQALRPAALVVAYSPSVSLMRRSVSGFLSDDHRPEYAALGIQVTDAPGGGAVIRRVVDGGPAGRAKIQVGDVLLAMGDHPIRHQYDFIEAMLAFRPGERIPVRVRHDGSEQIVEISLARSKS